SPTQTFAGVVDPGAQPSPPSSITLVWVRPPSSTRSVVTACGAGPWEAPASPSPAPSTGAPPEPGSSTKGGDHAWVGGPASAAGVASPGPSSSSADGSSDSHPSC